jgi:hypothetical protein
VVLKKWIAVLALSVVCASLKAESAIDGYNQTIKHSQNISALESDLFGDQTSLLDGATEFKVTDISVPTSSGIPLVFGRSLNVNAQTNDRRGGSTDWSKSPLGAYWNIDVPYLRATFDAMRGWVGADGNAQWRCTRAGQGPPGSYGVGSFSNIFYDADSFFSGITVNIPGYGTESAMGLIGGTPQQIGGDFYYAKTKSEWRIGCTPTIKNNVGEGFTVLLPDGVRYRFDWLVIRAISSVVDTTCHDSTFFRSQASHISQSNHCAVGASLPRIEAMMYATEAVDRYGNKVNYSFDSANPSRLLRIESSEGAAISMNYGSSNRLQAVSVGDRIWRYEVGNSLDRVVLPDSSAWSYVYGSNMTDITWYDVLRVWRNCRVNIDTKYTAVAPGVGESNFTTISSPSGAIATFHFRRILHGTKQSESSCYFATDVHGIPIAPVVTNPSAYQAVSLYKKIISGPGLTARQWDYEYSPSWVAPYMSTTTVRDSAGTVRRYIYGNDAAKNYGQLLEMTVGTSSEVLRKETYYYLESAQGQNFQERAGNVYSIAGRSWGGGFFSLNRPLYKTVVIENGVNFVNVVNTGCLQSGAYCFDSLVRPLRITKSSAPAP